MKNKYTINGKFLTQKITGVQRYANEIVKELDKIVQKGDLEIIVPRNSHLDEEYTNISVVRRGLFHGSAWEQISYPLYLILHRKIGINFCSSPIIKPDYAYMDDVTFQRNPNYCSKLCYIYTSILFMSIIYRAKKIFTISEFSKSEIQDYYKLHDKEITVISCAWQHMTKIHFDSSIFDKFPNIKKDNYIFSLSSISPNKNHKWIVENARFNPSQQYVIAGGINSLTFGNSHNLNEIGANIIYLGYVTDVEAKSLMTHAKAFLFPTFYEGFGIPPLEALSCGTKIIVSSIPCMKEVYENSAYYIDPHNPLINIDKLLTQYVSNPNDVLNKYDWANSAKLLLNELL